jgi:Electron transfer DM13
MVHPLIARMTLVTATAVLAAACSNGAATGSSTASQAAAAASPAGSIATGTMAKGQFHDVDGMAAGEAQLVVKPGGVYEVVLEGFKIDSIDHTNIVLVANTDVQSTADVDKAKLLDLGPLKSTEGMQDFAIPASMANGVMAGYHSVVVWDTAMAHAVAAAPLQ